MEYTINKESILGQFRQEIARTAAKQYSDDGASLYDGIWPTSQDDNIIDKLMDDSVNTIRTGFRHAFVKESPENTLVFNTPDIDPDVESPAKSSLDRFIVLDMCRAWMHRVFPGLEEKFSIEAAAAKEKALQLIYSRKKISRQ